VRNPYREASEPEPDNPEDVALLAAMASAGRLRARIIRWSTVHAVACALAIPASLRVTLALRAELRQDPRSAPHEPWYPPPAVPLQIDSFAESVGPWQEFVYPTHGDLIAKWCGRRPARGCVREVFDSTYLCADEREVARFYSMLDGLCGRLSP
jgi:hypothetical protein